MAGLEPLIQTHLLKPDTLIKIIEGGQFRLTVTYDGLVDALMLLFVPNDKAHVVHYLRGDVALLVWPDTLEVIGFWIENFRARFLSQSPEVKRLWSRFQDTKDPSARGETMAQITKLLIEAEYGAIGQPEDDEAELAQELVAAFG